MPDINVDIDIDSNIAGVAYTEHIHLGVRLHWFLQPASIPPGYVARCLSGHNLLFH